MLTLTRRLSFLFLALALTTMLALAQTPSNPADLPAAAAAPAAADASNVWSFLSDPNNIAPATFLLANVADAKTSWTFNLGQKQYAITPAQRLSIGGGGLFVALVLRHFYPKTAKPINVALGVATAYFAGRAYAGTMNHGTPAGPTPAGPTAAAAAPRIAFAIRLH